MALRTELICHFLNPHKSVKPIRCPHFEHLSPAHLLHLVKVQARPVRALRALTARRPTTRRHRTVEKLGRRTAAQLLLLAGQLCRRLRQRDRARTERRRRRGGRHRRLRRHGGASGCCRRRRTGVVIVVVVVARNANALNSAAGFGQDQRRDGALRVVVCVEQVMMLMVMQWMVAAVVEDWWLMVVMVVQMGERVAAMRLERLHRRCAAKVDQRRSVVGKVVQLQGIENQEYYC